MPVKRPRPDGDDDVEPSSSFSARRRPTKRPRLDLLSPLSDELLIRILSHLSLPQLLRGVAPVSHRFHRLAEDSQLWKGLYYTRFVLPRALRIPGFRRAMTATAMTTRDSKVHYKGRRALWADGRLGGLVREVVARRIGVMEDEEHGEEDRVNWKRQYKIRHNWARGKCAVEELKLGKEEEEDEDDADVEQHEEGHQNQAGATTTSMLVKVVEGLAVTADGTYGLRAWDLRTREVLAQLDLQTADNDDDPTPSCLAIDDRDQDKGTLDMAVGFTDGSFGVWRLDIAHKKLHRRYRHEKSSNGTLMGMAYLHPYLLTATGAVLISLYTFDIPDVPEDEEEEEDQATEPSTRHDAPKQQKEPTKQDGSLSPLPPPYLLTSLRSHTSNPPLALSIRKTATTTTVASIAYTFFVRQGWSIGIQDLHITAPPPSLVAKKPAPTITTRLAYTPPFESPPPRTTIKPSTSTHPHHSQHQPPPRSRSALTGPTSLCYTHPYLLATLPDNTLLLHLCTSTAATLSVSTPGIRLWGHTSGISDAQVTARGKAVSVSSRGEEMRVWELEGRSRSVQIRAESDRRWEERRNWVGFDDEMVIVLKEGRGGRESLLVYDFT